MISLTYLLVCVVVTEDQQARMPNDLLQYFPTIFPVHSVLWPDVQRGYFGCWPATLCKSNDRSRLRTGAPAWNFKWAETAHASFTPSLVLSLL